MGRRRSKAIRGQTNGTVTYAPLPLADPTLTLPPVTNPHDIAAPFSTTYPITFVPVHYNLQRPSPNELKRLDLSAKEAGKIWFPNAPDAEEQGRALLELCQYAFLPGSFHWCIRVLLAFLNGADFPFDLTFSAQLTTHEFLFNGEPVKLNLFSAPIGERRGRVLFKAGITFRGKHQQAWWTPS